MTGSCSLLREDGEDGEERAPAGVVNACGKGMVLDHSAEVHVFHTETTRPLGRVLGRLKLEVPPLPVDREVLLGDLSAGRTAVRLSPLRASGFHLLSSPA